MCVDEDLVRLAGEIRERELLAARKAGIDAAVAALRLELAELRRRHAIEVRDVERLENFSLTRVLADLRGSREQSLDRERAEAEAARYRVAQGQDRLDALLAQGAVVQARLVATSTAPATYAMVLAEKERQVLAGGAGAAPRLAAIAQSRGRLAAELEELTEARTAAAAAARAVDATTELLRSADNWSTADTFISGGGLISLVKHNRLDEAAALAAAADRRLAVLRAELRDVDLALPPLAGQLELDGFTRFADVWLDNIFTDLSVHGQIKDGLGRLAQAAQGVGRVRAALAERISANQAELARLDRERTALLHP